MNHPADVADLPTWRVPGTTRPMRHLSSAAVIVLALQYGLAADIQRSDREGLTLTIGSRGHLQTDGSDLDARIVRRDSMVSIPSDGPALEMLLAEKEEPYVSCGTTTASVCSACPQGHGARWCQGDCKWELATGQCVSKRHHGFVPDSTEAPASGTTTSKITYSGPYPANPGAMGSGVAGPLSDDSNITAPKVDKKAAEIRHEQARYEAEVAQRKKDEEKFIRTVIMSAGVSAAVVLFVFLCGYCVCFRTKSKQVSQ